MRFDLLEFCVLDLELLALGPECDHFLFLLLKIILFFLKLFLVLILVLINLTHLLLLLLKEFLVIVQLIVQCLNFLLLLLELRPHGVILCLWHSHRLLDHLQILDQLVILVIHLLDPVLQINLLIINNLLVL